MVFGSSGKDAYAAMKSCISILIGGIYQIRLPLEFLQNFFNLPLNTVVLIVR